MALPWSSKPRNAQDKGGRGGGDQVVRPPKAAYLLPSPPSTFLKDQGNSAWLSSQAHLPAGRENEGLSVPGPLPSPSLAGVAECGEWVDGVVTPGKGCAETSWLPWEELQWPGEEGWELGVQFVYQKPHKLMGALRSLDAVGLLG